MAKCAARNSRSSLRVAGLAVAGVGTLFNPWLRSLAFAHGPTEIASENVMQLTHSAGWT